MSKVILILSRDWADEFDVEQFVVMKDRQVAESRIAELAERGGWFGTNEGFEEGELSEEDFTIKDVSEEELTTIVKFFGTSFGTGVI